MHLSQLASVVLTGLVSVASAADAVAAAATPTCTYAKATPTPAGFTCEVQGSVKRPAILFNISPIANIQACAQRCINEPQCQSLGYTASSKTCMLYKKTLANQGFTQGATGVVFAAKACYTCQCAAGLSVCGKQCFNFKTDNNNCGKCGNVCRGGSVCRQGSCTCPSGNNKRFLWQVSSPNSGFDGSFVGYSDSNAGAGLAGSYNTSQYLTFTFQGTNVTTTVPDVNGGKNIRAIAIISSYADPMNPPTVNNTDGTGVHAAIMDLAQNGASLNTTETPPLNCVATPQRQLFCQNYEIVNKIQVCSSPQGMGDAMGVLVISDRYIQTAMLPCTPAAINLVCPGS